MFTSLACSLEKEKKNTETLEKKATKKCLFDEGAGICKISPLAVRLELFHQMRRVIKPLLKLVADKNIDVTENFKDTRMVITFVQSAVLGRTTNVGRMLDEAVKAQPNVKLADWEYHNTVYVHPFFLQGFKTKISFGCRRDHFWTIVDSG